jgi:hypothetical protein
LTKLQQALLQETETEMPTPRYVPETQGFEMLKKTTYVHGLYVEFCL